MLQHFLKAWKNNRGNLLLGLGVVAGILMCLVWYFKLVPEVRFASRSVNGTLISSSQRLLPSPLVATLRITAQPPSDEETPLVDLKAHVELYKPADSLLPEQAPLFSRFTTLRNDGVAQAVVFNDVQPGIYAVLAYLDLNDNQKFDIDAESHKALEPYRLSQATAPTDQAADYKPKPFDLERAAIEVVLDQTTLVEFDFRQAKK